MRVESLEDLAKSANEVDAHDSLPSTSDAWRILNNAKTVSILEGAVLEKLGKGVDDQQFKYQVSALEEQLEKITKYVVSHMDLKGIKPPSDNNSWEMNAIRSSWASRLAESWSKEGVSGIQGLFEKVPAIVELAISRTEKLRTSTREPYRFKPDVSFQLTLDEVAAKILDVVSFAPEKFKKTQVIDYLLSDIVRLAKKSALLLKGDVEGMTIEMENSLFQSQIKRTAKIYTGILKAEMRSELAVNAVLESVAEKVSHQLDVKDDIRIKLNEAVARSVTPRVS